MSEGRGSWWTDPAAQSDRVQFNATAASREPALRNDRRFGGSVAEVNIITARDEQGMRASHRAPKSGKVQATGHPKINGEHHHFVLAPGAQGAVSCIGKARAAEFVAAVQARARSTAGQPAPGIPPVTINVNAVPSGEIKMNATESTVTLNHTLKLKGVTKYAAVYTIPGVPGQLMVRRNMLGGEAPQELVIEGIEFKPVDPKAAERQARASKRTDSAQERAVKAAERAKKAVERARKAQELADRLAGKKADAEVDETTDGPNDPDAAEGDAASA